MKMISVDIFDDSNDENVTIIFDELVKNARCGRCDYNDRYLCDFQQKINISYFDGTFILKNFLIVLQRWMCVCVKILEEIVKLLAFRLKGRFCLVEKL